MNILNNEKIKLDIKSQFNNGEPIINIADYYNVSKYLIRKLLKYDGISISQVKDILNKKFGRLTVISLNENRGKNRERIQTCKCDCGNITEQSTACLTRSKSPVRSCGCLQKEKAGMYNVLNANFILSTYRSIYSSYKKRATKLSLSFNISIDDFIDITKMPCYYCDGGFSNIRKNKSNHNNDVLVYNGIDRIDNKIGYQIDNVVPCCKICNKMKLNQTYDEFITQIRKILNHHSSR